VAASRFRSAVRASPEEPFQIQSKNGKPLYAGTVRVNPSAKPAVIDFENTEGIAKGKAWNGIYKLDGRDHHIRDYESAENKTAGQPFPVVLLRPPALAR
jgi:uncharacterized protein (TIGR03067 family)